MEISELIRKLQSELDESRDMKIAIASDPEGNLIYTFDMTSVEYLYYKGGGERPEACLVLWPGRIIDE